MGITLARERERSLGPAGTKLQQKPNISALLGLILGSAAPSRDEEEVSPLRAAASCAVASAKALLWPAFLARLHVEAVLLDFLNDVFLLHLALKAAQAFSRDSLS